MASSRTRRTNRRRATPAAARHRADRLLRELRDLPPDTRARVDAFEGWQRDGDARSARDAFVADGLPGSHDAILDVLEVARLDDLGITPSWVVNRWIARQALRSLSGQQPGVLGRTLDLTGSFVAPWPEPDEADDLADFSQLAVEVLYRNWLAGQVGVYAEGGLATFLSDHAGGDLLARAHRIDDWVAAPWGVYHLGFAAGGTLSVHDLRTSEERLLLHLGTGTMNPDGAVVLGRVVPIEEDPGEMFESAPLRIDDETASRLRDKDLTPRRVCAELRRAVDRGRIRPEPIASAPPTDLVSDVEERRLSMLLTAPDPAATDPDEAVELFDIVRDQLQHTGASAAARMVPFLLPSLLIDPHLDALREHRTRAEDAEVWRHVVHDLPIFARGRADALRAACPLPERAGLEA